MEIYVGNLARSITPEYLADAFRAYGAVKTARVRNCASTDKIVFGFVEMEAEDSALAAIAALNGAQWCGKTMRVERAGWVRQKAGISNRPSSTGN